MTARNPLGDAKSAYTSKLTAAEWAAIAREKGNPKAALAWSNVAEERGEEPIPHGLTVRFDRHGVKHRVPVNSGNAVRT